MLREGYPIIDRPDDVAATIRPLRSSDGTTDRIDLFETARDGAPRPALVDAIGTGYDVAVRYLADLTTDLLAEQKVRGTRLYAPEPLGDRVGDAIDAYQERMAAVDPARDPDAYLAAAAHRLTPGRIRVLDAAVAGGVVTGEDIADLLDLDDTAAAHVRARPLTDVSLLSAETGEEILYTYSDTGERVLDALASVDNARAATAFRTLRNGDSYRVLQDNEDIDSMAALARDLDVSKRTAYDWRDGLQEAGYVDDDAAITGHGARFRDAFAPLADEMNTVATALQSEDRMRIFLNADQAARSDIADRTGMPLTAVRNLTDDIESRGLLARTKEPGTRYRPGTYAGPVHGLLTAIDTALTEPSGDTPTPAERCWPDLPDPFDSPEAYDEFLVLAGVLGRGGDMATAADILDIHEETARSRATDLVDQGLLDRDIDRSGSGRGSTSTYTMDPGVADRFGAAITDRLADLYDLAADHRSDVLAAVTGRFPDQDAAADAARTGDVLADRLNAAHAARQADDADGTDPEVEEDVADTEVPAGWTPDPATLQDLRQAPHLGTPGKRHVLAYLAEEGRADRDTIYDMVDLDNRELGQGVRFLARAGLVAEDEDGVELTGDGEAVYEDPVGGDTAAVGTDSIDLDMLATVVAELRKGNTLSDVEDRSGKSYGTVKGRYDTFERHGFVDHSGPNWNRNYSVDDAALAEAGVLEDVAQRTAHDLLAYGASEAADLARFANTYDVASHRFRDAWDADELPEDMIIPQWQEFLAVARASTMEEGTIADATVWTGCSVNSLEDRLDRLPDDAVTLHAPDGETPQKDRRVRVHPRFHDVLAGFQDRLDFPADAVTYATPDDHEPEPDGGRDDEMDDGPDGPQWTDFRNTE